MIVSGGTTITTFQWVMAILRERLLPSELFPGFMHLRVFNLVGESFAGTESLQRADLYQGQACPQDAANLPGGTWSLLDLAVDYRACHRFERTSTS